MIRPDLHATRSLLYFSDYKAHLKFLYLLKNQQCALYSSAPYVWTLCSDCAEKSVKMFYCNFGKRRSHTLDCRRMKAAGF